IVATAGAPVWLLAADVAEILLALRAVRQHTRRIAAAAGDVVVPGETRRFMAAGHAARETGFSPARRVTAIAAHEVSAVTLLTRVAFSVAAQGSTAARGAGRHGRKGARRERPQHRDVPRTGLAARWRRGAFPRLDRVARAKAGRQLEVPCRSQA